MTSRLRLKLLARMREIYYSSLTITSGIDIYARITQLVHTHVSRQLPTILHIGNTLFMYRYKLQVFKHNFIKMHFIVVQIEPYIDGSFVRSEQLFSPTVRTQK